MEAKNHSMIYSIKGKLVLQQDNFFVLEIGGLALKIRTSSNALRSLPQVGGVVNAVTHLHVREDALELYGFLDPAELRLFEQFIGVSGIGPKSALGILGIDSVDRLQAAISEGRVELLTKASGIGRKTAERIILELRGKLKQSDSAQLVGLMQSEQDLAEVLVSLGYSKNQAREALTKVDAKIVKLEDRVKAALKILKK